MRDHGRLRFFGIALLTFAGLAMVACGGGSPDQLVGAPGGEMTDPSQTGTGSPAAAGDGGAGGGDAQPPHSGSTTDGGGKDAHAGGDADAAATPDAKPAFDAGSPDAADPLAAARALCVKTINDYRATVGSPPVSEWNAAESCTDNEAKADYTANTPHHAFGSCGEWAQDECPGWPGDPSSIMTGCLQMMWAEGPGGGHYENMKNPSSTKVSCGFYKTPGGDYWATQNFM